jgi:hypothetical protein
MTVTGPQSKAIEAFKSQLSEVTDIADLGASQI